ncbi:ATP-binding protein [Leptolyngbya sp. PCC 6406]|uniref:ATP-binding protein n=1 Tax=Leptolyngbya sp. PCC 6406 TaxID=1173264 RepID=UPI0002AD15AE|nr:ATP-binding protein [Leptolyngbya sp. PCC 6406]
MTGSNPSDRFMQAYRNLALFPLLEAQEIENFRVKYGQRTLARLKQEILASQANGKVIFTGHRGCGKSTLLNEFAGQMRQRQHFVVFFSIADMVEMSDVNHVNILYSVALMLLSKATKLQVPIPETTKNNLLNWFTETKSKTYTDQLKQEMSVGVNVLEFLQGKLQKEDTFREEIKVTYERRVSELSNTIDRIAAAIQAATQKEVLVIIDDLDKLDLSVVEAIYRDNINALFSPNIRIVFTIPISVVREPRLLATLQSCCQIILLSVTKFFPQDQAHRLAGEALEENVDILLGVLKKRIDPDLVEPDVLRQLVLLSGGVLRELIRLAQECCRECMLELDLNPENADVVINAEVLAAAVKTLRNQFARSLGSQLYELLGQIYAQFTPPDARSPQFLELLHGLYVLEYENDDLWYDLHPLVTDLLRRKQLIGAPE